MQKIIFLNGVLIILSFLITYFLIPKVQSLGNKWNTKDFPNERKKQKFPLIRIGGLGIVISIITTALIFLTFHTQEINFIYSKFIITIFMITFAFLIGFFDDLFKLSPYLRLALQLLLGGFCWSLGIQIREIFIPFLNQEILIPTTMSFLITMLWIAGCINALNWIDGQDGLASGYGLITSLGLLFLGIIYNNLEFSYFCALIVGSCLGFLPHNLENSYEKKIIMGDGGSYLIGCGLAILSIQIPIFQNRPLNVFYPLIFLAHPILDMVNVIINRLIKGKSPFHPDRSHFHHRLKDLGFSVLQINGYSFTLSQFLISLSLTFNAKEIQPLWLISSLIFSTIIIRFIK